MTAPPQAAVDAALLGGAQSPCAKSKRGVCVYVAEDPDPEAFIEAVGHNRPPFGLACDGSSACRASCNRRCVHAEMAALRALKWSTRESIARLDLVHVEVGSDGTVMPCGGPSCWQCSREILDVGIGGVWLCEADPLKCPLGENGLCENGPRALVRASGSHSAGKPYLYACHAVPASGVWRRYTAEEFHRVTCANAKDGSIYYGGGR